MSRIKSTIKGFWQDPVISNVIANALTAFAAYLFYKLISGSETKVPSPKVPRGPAIRGPVTDSAEQMPSSIPSSFFETPLGHLLIYIVFGCLAVLMVIFLYKMIRGIVKNRRM
jgi:hypothetical protein